MLTLFFCLTLIPRTTISIYEVDPWTTNPNQSSHLIIGVQHRPLVLYIYIALTQTGERYSSDERKVVVERRRGMEAEAVAARGSRSSNTILHLSMSLCLSRVKCINSYTTC